MAAVQLSANPPLSATCTRSDLNCTQWDEIETLANCVMQYSHEWALLVICNGYLMALVYYSTPRYLTRISIHFLHPGTYEHVSVDEQGHTGRAIPHVGNGNTQRRRLRDMPHQHLHA